MYSRVALLALALLSGACASAGAGTKADVPITIGKTAFAPGDEIRIEQVTGTRSELAVGGEYEIRGRYTLASRDAALLALNSTAFGDDVRTSGDKERNVTGGSGAFVLRFAIHADGDLHLSFYPADGGESFGGVYFRSPTRPFLYASSN